MAKTRQETLQQQQQQTQQDTIKINATLIYDDIKIIIIMIWCNTDTQRHAS